MLIYPMNAFPWIVNGLVEARYANLAQLYRRSPIALYSPLICLPLSKGVGATHRERACGIRSTDAPVRAPTRIRTRQPRRPPPRQPQLVSGPPSCRRSAGRWRCSSRCLSSPHRPASNIIVLAVRYQRRISPGLDVCCGRRGCCGQDIAAAWSPGRGAMHGGAHAGSLPALHGLLPTGARARIRIRS